MTTKYKPNSINDEDLILAEGLIRLWEQGKTVTQKQIGLARGYNYQAAQWYLKRLEAHGLLKLTPRKGYVIKKSLPKVFYDMLAEKTGYKLKKVAEKTHKGKLIQEMYK